MLTLHTSMDFRQLPCFRVQPAKGKLSYDLLSNVVNNCLGIFNKLAFKKALVGR